MRLSARIKGDIIIGRYFGTDGFRGEAGVKVTARKAYEIGRILGYALSKQKGEKCKAVIGKDTRLSSYMLEYSLASGLTASGADAYVLHVTTTPSVSYITRCDGFDCGIMISASHNPYFDNGIKIMNGRGEKADGELIETIENYLDGKHGEIPFASGKDIGRTVDYISGRNRYIGHLISLSSCSYKDLKVGIDGANGSAYEIAKNVFETLGAKTYCIGDTPDGCNINDGVGSCHTEKLCALVKENNLDIGFAFDGDADRCICVDERGEVLTGDEEMYILANRLKKRGALMGNKIVCTVLSNGGLLKSLNENGISAEISDVGDSNVWAMMNKSGAVLGGERSGHIVLSKYETTGDGLVTAIMLMEAAIDGSCKISELLKKYKSFPQYELNVPSKDKIRSANALKPVAEKLQKDLGLRIIVRPSGTEDVVRIFAEGENYYNCVSAARKLSAEILS